MAAPAGISKGSQGNAIKYLPLKNISVIEMKKTIDSEKFLQIFSNQFEEKVGKNISMGSAFKQITGWSSLQALIVTVAINEEWGVSFSDEDFRNSQSFKDLFEITKIKTGS